MIRWPPRSNTIWCLDASELMSNATHDSPLKEYPAVFKNVSHVTVTSSVLPNCVRDLLVNDYIVRLLPISLNPEYDPFYQHHGRFPFQKLRSVSDELYFTSVGMPEPSVFTTY